MSAERRWLLLLGSNLDHDAVVREALRRLNALGPLDTLTQIRRFPAYGNSRGPYFNVLAQWHRDTQRSDILLDIKALELALGRDRAASDRIDIDIDILAFANADAHWVADPHAVAKHEFTHPPVIELLREAGIKLQNFNLTGNS